MGVTLIIVMVVASVLAQDSLRRELDSLTYQQYLNKDYKNLIETGKKAREQHINFYYLNYRTAIAYYELKNYAKAAEFYRKTLAETPDDPILQESLYYSYLLSGQKENAAIVARSLAPHTQVTIGYKPSSVDYISLSGGYMTNDNTPDIRSDFAGNDSVNQYRDMIFTSLGLGFNLSSRSRFKLGYQVYNTNFEQYTTTGLAQTDKLTQYQLVGALEFFTENNVSWGVAGGYYFIELFDRTAIYTLGGGGKGFGPGTGRIFTTSGGKSVSAFSALVFLNKRFAYTLPEIAATYSNFGGGHQYQVKGSLTYYPLGNLNFYGTTAAAVIRNQDAWTDTQLIFSQSLGVKLTKQLWLDGNISLGNHRNYVSERSFLVYDTYDPVKAIAGLSLSCFFRDVMLSAGYQWQQREGYAYSAINYSAYKYNNHLLNIAFTWNL